MVKSRSIRRYRFFGIGPYGALDMAGNVWEWTADWYDSGYYNDSQSRNPLGPESGERRVVRGGSWFSNPRNVRAVDRFMFNPKNHLEPVGFRVRLSSSLD